MQRLTIVATLIVGAGVAHFGARTKRALDAESARFVVAGETLQDPITARQRDIPILARSLPPQEILRRRGYAMPAAGASVGLCGLSPGLVGEGPDLLVLLAPTRFGVLAESPTRGVLMLSDAEAAAMAERCTPALPMTSTSSGELTR